MRRLSLPIVAVLSLVVPSRADYWPPPRDHVPQLELLARPRGDTTAPGPAWLASSTIAAIGDGALVIDVDSGELVRTDASGSPISRVAIGSGAGTLVYDPASHRAYVADRFADRIAVVEVGERLVVAASWPTPAEPFGVALSADATTLFVTTIADRTLVAIDPRTGDERWRVAIDAEPRGVATAPDGSRALVASLTGVVDIVELRGRLPTVRHVVLGGQVVKVCDTCADPVATSFPRAAFAVRFLGSHTAVVAFQREIPQPRSPHDAVESYGGSRLNVTRHVAFLELDVDSVRQVAGQIAQAEARAIAWDPERDAVYIAGMGSGTVLQIAGASRRSVRAERTSVLDPDRSLEACGPDGLAVAADGALLVWCALSRRVAKVYFGTPPPGVRALEAELGPELTASRLSATEHAGMVLYHRASPAVSVQMRATCATCHLDGRSDGLSWQIDGHTLQTPVLAGRLADTAPYKWSGRDVDLPASIHATIQRLGGRGVGEADTLSLAAYLQTLPPVRPATGDPGAIARGRALFETFGCTACHGGPAYTDGAQHRFPGTRFDVDTPSLRGLAASAPYYHDGSAPTLDALLRGRGSVHGMIPKIPDAAQRRDLVAFLTSL